jgi:hypothetical protein
MSSFFAQLVSSATMRRTHSKTVDMQAVDECELINQRPGGIAKLITGDEGKHNKFVNYTIVHRDSVRPPLSAHFSVLLIAQWRKNEALCCV